MNREKYVSSFVELIRRASTDLPQDVGEALRRAKNSNPFLRQAETLLGAPVEIIGGSEEARLSLDGALAGWPEPAAGPLLLADVGGGSTAPVLYPSNPSVADR